MVAKLLLNIFESESFRDELVDLSAYAASIRQERPIVHLFAKHFWRRGHSTLLEGRYNRATGERPRERCDLLVDDTTVEFKCHVDCDMFTVGSDLRKCGGDLEQMWQRVKSNGNRNWGVCPNIYSDITIKRPDLFAWIITSRDLDGISPAEMYRIVVSNEHIRYRRSTPFDPNGSLLDPAQKLLAAIQEIRPFNLTRSTVLTAGWFPSAYHLFVLDFKAH